MGVDTVYPLLRSMNFYIKYLGFKPMVRLAAVGQIAPV